MQLKLSTIRKGNKHIEGRIHCLYCPHRRHVDNCMEKRTLSLSIVDLPYCAIAYDALILHGNNCKSDIKYHPQRR